MVGHKTSVYVFRQSFWRCLLGVRWSGHILQTQRYLQSDKRRPVAKTRTGKIWSNFDAFLHVCSTLLLTWSFLFLLIFSPICSKTLNAPFITPCGHSFWWASKLLAVSFFCCVLYYNESLDQADLCTMHVCAKFLFDKSTTGIIVALGRHGSLIVVIFHFQLLVCETMLGKEKELPNMWKLHRSLRQLDSKQSTWVTRILTMGLVPTPWCATVYLQLWLPSKHCSCFMSSAVAGSSPFR